MPKAAIDPKAALHALPPLIKGYLRLGAHRRRRRRDRPSVRHHRRADRAAGLGDQRRYIEHFGPGADATRRDLARDDSARHQIQSRRSATSSTRWLSSFLRIRSARWRVGRMFSCRLTRLIRVPDRGRGLQRLGVGQLGIAVEVGFRIAERGLAQRQEAVDIPVLQHRPRRRRDRSRNRRSPRRRGSPCRPSAAAPVCSTLRPSTIRMSGRSISIQLVRHHVVDEMRIDRRARPAAGRP